MNEALIIATGPTLKREDVDYCKNKIITYTVNNAYLLAPWAEYLYACDYAWWKHYNPEFNGEKWTGTKGAADEFNLNYIPYDTSKIFATEPPIATGGNSGFQAINLAYIHGIRKIYLLGFDYSSPGMHFFGKHPQKLNKTPDMRNWVDHMTKAKPLMDKAGLEVINCSLLSAIECFPKAKIQDCI